MSWPRYYQQGKAGESAIARWLTSLGYSVLPVYEKSVDDGKAPTLFQLNRRLIAPDLCVFTDKGVRWMEAKHKSGWTFWRKGGVFETGIDRHHWLDYCKIRDSIGLPVWLLFLQRGGQAKDSPPSPPGLFGAELAELRENISHESDYGTSGMIYWTREQDGGPLKFIASYDEVVRHSVPDNTASTRATAGV